MNTLDLIIAFGHIDQNFVHEAIEFAQAERPYIRDTESTAPPPSVSRSAGRRARAHRRVLALLAAIVLLLALGIAAYAIWSVNSHRQEALREALGVRGSEAPAYVEYPAEEETPSGIALLSAINDGAFQRVFVSVSPVSESELSMETQQPFAFSIDGGASWQDAFIVPGTFDEESQSLMLYCAFHTDTLPAGTALELEISIPYARPVRGYGSAAFTVTDPDVRLVNFTEAVEVVFPLTGDNVRILGVELGGESAIWLLEPEDEPGDLFGAMQADWSLFTDELVRAAELKSADGSSVSCSGVLSYETVNGVIKAKAPYDKAVLGTDSVTEIVIGGVRVPINSY